jgi:flagellar protein FliS
MSTMMPEGKYLLSAVQSASPISLTILLYDRLVTDIRLSMAAIEEGNIEKRCECVNHAFLVLAQLESGLNMEDGGQTAADLARVYRHVSAALLEASAKNSAEILEKETKLILQLRQAWQQAETAARPSTPVPTASAQFAHNLPEDRPTSSWTA